LMIGQHSHHSIEWQLRAFLQGARACSKVGMGARAHEPG